MLPADTAVGAVSLQVGDLDRSLAFYRDVIGFRELRQRVVDGQRTASLGVVASERVWLELVERPGARRIPSRGLLGLYHFAVLLPSRGHLGRFFAHAVNAGAQVASANHLVSEALYLVDPDGLTIEIYHDLPRSGWPRTNGELTLATLPLDVDGVVGAATNVEPWAGLPADTTMGHMHFFVGDLPAAETFYVKGLGFDPVLRSFPGALFISAGGYHHHVGLNTWIRHARTATEGDARLRWWELIVPTAADVAAARARLAESGYLTTDVGSSVEAADSWGNRVRLRSRN